MILQSTILRKENKRKEEGFTLVEIAIVLVIIGLIIGAVVKGQDLMSSAQAKSVVKDVEKASVLALAVYDKKSTLTLDKDGDGTDDIKSKYGTFAITNNQACLTLSSTYKDNAELTDYLNTKYGKDTDEAYTYDKKNAIVCSAALI